MYFGGHDAETSDYRSDCALRLHSLRNSPIAALLTRRKCLVVRGHRLSGDWASAYSDERRGRGAHIGRAITDTERIVHIVMAMERIPAVYVLQSRLWIIPAVRVRVSAVRIPAVVDALKGGLQVQLNTNRFGGGDLRGGLQLSTEVINAETTSCRSDSALRHSISNCFRTGPFWHGAKSVKPADLARLTDERIAIVKSVLQLTPDQEKYWPAIADAIRFRAQNRDARLARIAETVGKMSDESVSNVLRNRDPVAFLDRRADALAQRSQDLKKLANAWRPLYTTLSPEQKQRMAALTIFALHQASNAIEQRMQSDDDDEWLVIMR